MGGHALKTVKSIRLPKDAFTSVMAYVSKAVEHLGDTFIPLYSSDKMSFGDLDVIIYPNESDVAKFIEIIKTLFSPREVVKHASVISIDFNLHTFDNGSILMRNDNNIITSSDTMPAFSNNNVIAADDGDSFQVDFILVSSHCFKVSCFYFSFNDFGAILGMMFKQWGFGFGSEGLFYEVFPQQRQQQQQQQSQKQYADGGDVIIERNHPPQHNHQVKLGRVYITADVLEICKLAGLEPLYFFDDNNNNKHGGESTVTWNMIFEWLATSPLFHPLYWTNQSRCFNHDQRKRAEIRPMFRQFLFEFIPSHYPVIDDGTADDQLLATTDTSTILSNDSTVAVDINNTETTATAAVNHVNTSEQSSLSSVTTGTKQARIQFISDESRNTFIQQTLHYFHKTQQVDDLINEYNIARKAKEKFNGVLVSEVTGLVDQELGMLMTRLRKEYSTTLGSYTWLASDENTVDDIRLMIIEANNS